MYRRILLCELLKNWFHINPKIQNGEAQHYFLKKRPTFIPGFCRIHFVGDKIITVCIFLSWVFSTVWLQPEKTWSTLLTAWEMTCKLCRNLCLNPVDIHRNKDKYSSTHVSFLFDHSDTVMEYLINVTTAQEFRPWEVSELTARVKLDKAEAAGNTQIGGPPLSDL